MRHGAIAVVVVSLVACGGSGGGASQGSNPVGPPPPVPGPPPPQIAGTWTNGVCTITGAKGTGCFAQATRKAIGYEEDVDVVVTQTGSSITLEIALLEPLEPHVFEGTIDSNGRIVAEQTQKSNGVLGFCEDGTVAILSAVSGRMTGTASPTEMNLRVVQELNASLFGFSFEDWTWIKTIEASR